MRTKLSNVLTVDRSSRLRLESKNSTHPAVSRTSQGAVPIVAGQGKTSVMVMVVAVAVDTAPEHHARCFP